MLHKLEPLLCSDLCWPGHPLSQLRGHTTQNSTGSCLLTWSICGPSQPLVSMLYTVPLMHLSILYISSICIYLIIYQPTCTSNLSTWLSIFRHIYLSIYPISILPHQSEMQIQAAWALTLSFEDHHGSGKLPSLWRLYFKSCMKTSTVKLMWKHTYIHIINIVVYIYMHNIKHIFKPRESYHQKPCR